MAQKLLPQVEELIGIVKATLNNLYKLGKNIF